MHRINLLPWREQAIDRAKRNALWISLILPISISILVLVIDHINHLINTQNTQQQRQIHVIRQQLQSINAQQRQLHIAPKKRVSHVTALHEIFKLTDQLLVRLPLKYGYLQKVSLNANNTKYISLLRVSGNLSHKSQFSPLRQYIESFFKKHNWQISTKLIELTQSSTNENHFILEIMFVKKIVRKAFQDTAKGSSL